MGFSDKHTTADKISKDSSQEKKEKDKIVISNDAFALGELLECLINTMRRN